MTGSIQWRKGQKGNKANRGGVHGSMVGQKAELLTHDMQWSSLSLSLYLSLSPLQKRRTDVSGRASQ